MPDVNISKDQPSKSEGLGGIGEKRSKNAARFKIYSTRFLNKMHNLKSQYFTSSEVVWCIRNAGGARGLQGYVCFKRGVSFVIGHFQSHE